MNLAGVHFLFWGHDTRSSLRCLDGGIANAKSCGVCYRAGGGWGDYQSVDIRTCAVRGLITLEKRR